MRVISTGAKNTVYLETSNIKRLERTGYRPVPDICQSVSGKRV